MKDIRLLKPEEISAKVKTVYGGSALLLLYKDARVDMTILDETFGAMHWKRSHKEVKGNLFCTISVFDELQNQWVDKEDVGIESMTEAEKGEASDSFKRAGTNWGIGRELYTSPKIMVPLDSGEYKDKKVFTSFYVSDIGYNVSREIAKLVIIDGNGRVRFSWESGKPLGNQPVEEFDLEAYRADVEAMLQSCDLIDNDKKALTLKGLPKYDKKLLDSVVARIKELEKSNG